MKIFPTFQMNQKIAFICDGAIYIRKAGSKIFPSANIQLCKFHFWQTLEAKFKNKELVPHLVKDQKIPNQFKEHLNVIRLNDKPNYDLAKVLRFDIKILQNLPTQKMVNKKIMDI